MRQLARFTAIILLTLSGILLAWAFRNVLLLIILSLIVAAAVRPIIVRLVNVGLPAIAAQVIVYLIGLGGLTALFVAFGKPFAIEIGNLTNWLISKHQQLHAVWLSGDPWQQAIASRLLKPNEFYATLLGNDGQVFIRATVGFAQNLAGLMAGFLLILVLSIYWSLDQGHFERLWLSFLSVDYRVQARNGWRNIEKEIGSFVRSQIAQLVVAILLLGVGYSLIGVKYPLILAILGGLSYLLPIVGMMLILGPAFIIGSISGTGIAIATVLFTSLIYLGLHFFLEPRLHNRSRYSGITLLLAMIPLVDTFGLIGFIIAPPIAILVQLISAGLIRFNMTSYKTAVQLKQIEQRLSEIKNRNQTPEKETPPEIENILTRLQTLIEQAKSLNPNSAPPSILGQNQP